MTDNEYEAFPTEAQVGEFELLEPLLESAIKEMREFAKKKQDGVVNATKVKLLNRLLDDVRTHLKSEPSIRYLDALDGEELPQNSDVVLILGQYKAVMANFRSRFMHHSLQGRYWQTQERLREEDKREEEEDEADTEE